jgi:hypothetical protein
LRAATASRSQRSVAASSMAATAQAGAAAAHPRRRPPTRSAAHAQEEGCVGLTSVRARKVQTTKGAKGVEGGGARVCPPWRHSNAALPLASPCCLR